jgi:hypothetical protein
MELRDPPFTKLLMICDDDELGRTEKSRNGHRAGIVIPLDEWSTTRKQRLIYRRDYVTTGGE